MRSKALQTAAVFAALATATAATAADRISGEYVEARTCDVWTGPCFSNSEINLTGENAVMAWIVDEGTWNGVRLDGLRVAAAVNGEGTLQTASEGKTKAVVYVDARADAKQAASLLAMAKKLAPHHLGKVVKVEEKTISYERNGQQVKLAVGGKKAEVQLATTALSYHCDIICGNEEKAYPTIGTTVRSDCAKTVANLYRGKDLGKTWSEPNARSAMIGRFELGAVLTLLGK